jgi:predicted transcriptional regulator
MEALYAFVMEIALTPEQEARLIQMAEIEGKTPSELVVNAVLEADLAAYHWDDENIRETIRQRVAEADKGIFIEEDEMDARVQRMLQA